MIGILKYTSGGKKLCITLLLKYVLNDAFIRDDFGFDIEDRLLLP